MEFSELCFKRCPKVRRAIRHNEDLGPSVLDLIDTTEDVFNLKNFDATRAVAVTVFRPEFGSGYVKSCDGVKDGEFNLSALPQGVNLLEAEPETLELAVVCGRVAAPAPK